jgi:hypothetical protein
MRAVCVANDPQQNPALSADGAWRQANLALWFFARQIQAQLPGAHCTRANVARTLAPRRSARLPPSANQ